jgi:peptidoglycan/LPS O-acetylase OafA/YrhL
LAVGVVIGHCGIVHVESVSVWFFFVLSGYLLAGLYPNGMQPHQLGPYAVRRAARLVPLCAVVLVAITLVPNWLYDAVLRPSEAVKFEGIAATFLEHLTFQRGNIHFWTLSQEALGYALIAALVLMRSRLRAGPFIALCAAVAVFFDFLWIIPMPSDGFARPFYAMHFAIGVAAAQVPAGKPKRWASAASIVILGAILVAAMFGEAIKSAWEVPFWEHAIPRQLWGLIAAAAILGLAHGSDVLGRFGFFGTISYGTYVFHYLVLLIVVSLNTGTHDPLVIFLKVGSITFVLAWLSYRYIEEPCIRWAASLRHSEQRATEAA